MLQRLDLLIVQDIFPTETSQYAHILLPAAVVSARLRVRPYSPMVSFALVPEASRAAWAAASRATGTRKGEQLT